MATQRTKGQLAAIEQADAILRTAETQTIDRTNEAIDRSFGELSQKLRKAWPKYSEGDTFATDRATLLIAELSAAINVLDPQSPRTKSIQKEYRALLKLSDQNGNQLAGQLLASYGDDRVVAVDSTVSMQADVLAQVSKEAYDRLLKHGATFANEASIIVQQGIIQGWGAKKTAAALASRTGIVKTRAEMIVRTESAKGQNKAAEKRYAAEGVDLIQVVETQDDRVCPYCAARAGRIYKIGEYEVVKHPNCRGYSIPVKQEWIDEGLVDFDWATEHSKNAIAKAGGANNGLSAFERSAGLSAPPTPFWSPGQPLPETIGSGFDFSQKTKKVGSGAYGEVRVTVNGPPVAIKRGSISAEEIEIIKTLSDSGVTPKFIAAKSDRRGDQVAMEFIEGRQISSLKGADADDAYISAHLALAKIHRAGISHGDIGDENILVTKDKKVYFVDFGLADLDDPYTILSEAMGFPDAKDNFSTVNFKSQKVKDFSDLQDTNRKELISALKKDGIKVKYTKTLGVEFLDYSEAISPQNLQRYLDIMYRGSTISHSQKNNAAIAALKDLNEGAKWVQITIAQQKELEKVLKYNKTFDIQPIQSISGAENLQRLELTKSQLSRTKIWFEANDGVEDYRVDWHLDKTQYNGMYFAEDVEVNKNAVTELKKINPPGFLSIAVGINETFVEDKSLSKKQAIRRALQMARAWKEILSSLPEGTVVHNTPVGGKGGKRERFYRGNGFGAVGASGQYGIVVIEDGEKVVKPILLDRKTND